jgi:hypothetical protein
MAIARHAPRGDIRAAWVRLKYNHGLSREGEYSRGGVTAGLMGWTGAPEAQVKGPSFVE